MRRMFFSTQRLNKLFTKNILFSCFFILFIFIFITKIEAKNETKPGEKKEVLFKKSWIKFGSKKIKVEIADDDKSRQQGLMERTSLPKNEGMLFIFKNEKTLSFWMKIPLTIGYFNKNKVLVDMQDMKPTSMLQLNYPSYPSKKPAMYALEMNQGWFKKNKIKLGMKFHFVKQTREKK